MARTTSPPASLSRTALLVALLLAPTRAAADPAARRHRRADRGALPVCAAELPGACAGAKGASLTADTAACEAKRLSRVGSSW
jgi:hypothetical protein